MLFLLHLPAPVIVFIFAGILALLAILGAREPLEFIYFQF
jgi:hypothetical protein